ncbi:hypothetical protein FPV67DRAFT_1451676 [Lyophyllum atratum]|nr:hypothetical protein FPV67DRAFT_1451676 [Lyophyllum atratum]
MPLSDSSLLKIGFALEAALSDTRESPWYAVWNIVLGDVIFRDLCSDSKGSRTTVTHPQHALVYEVDTKDDDDVHRAQFPTPLFPFRDETSNDVVMSDATGADAPNEDSDLRPVTPTPTSRESNAPSPESVSTDRRVSTPIYSGSPSSYNSSVRSPSAAPQIKHSTRIPDFVEILYRKDAHGDQRKYVLLLVENKKKPSEFNGQRVIGPFHFVEVIAQTEQQARHAFSAAGNSHIMVIGVIVALGPFWRYAEYRREAFITKDIPAMSRSKSEETYIPSESEDDNPKPKPPSLRLQVVRQRMKELAATYELGVHQGNLQLLNTTIYT